MWDDYIDKKEEGMEHGQNQSSKREEKKTNSNPKNNLNILQTRRKYLLKI